MTAAGSSPIRLQFRDCSPDHARPGSLLRRVSELAAGTTSVVVKEGEGADLIFVSDRLPLARKSLQSALYASRRIWDRVAPNRVDPRASQWRKEVPSDVPAIWFTQENARPPDGSWAGFLSFDLDPLDGRNAYFPLWWWLVDSLGAPGTDHFLGRSVTVAELMSSRMPQRSERSGFACAFINNPTPPRMHAIRALQRIGRVDVYGRAVGRPVGSKLETARKYRFVLCFENDVYPGYVTEKVFEAWATGAVPLWWGQDPAGYLNPKAFLNAATPSSVAQMADEVARLNASPSEWADLVAQPLLTRPPDLTDAIEVVRRALR